MNTLKDWQDRFGDQYVVFEESQDGIVLVKIDHPLATATISLQGGQVLQWQPKFQVQPVLWSAESMHWKKGRAIRAGIPICWPWFGAHPVDSSAPAHGYARICPWEVTSVSTSHSGPVEICMAMPMASRSTATQIEKVTLTSRMSIGETLSISLATNNASNQPLVITEALHAYFKVSDIRDIEILGLNECEYIDLIDQNARKTQTGAVRFTNETGRVFINTMNDCFIHDSGYDRTIKIEKTGSQSTVVWNPWQDTASKMNDLGSEQWQKMVCIETANALDNAQFIESCAQHTLSVKYSIE